MPVVPTLRPLKTLPTLEMECVSPSLSLSSKLRPFSSPSLFGSFHVLLSSVVTSSLPK